LSRAQSNRFRLKQVGLVLLVLVVAVPWTMGASSDAPSENRPEPGRSTSLDEQPGTEPDPLPEPTSEIEIDVPDEPVLEFAAGQEDDWATVTSDDLAYQSPGDPSDVFGMVGRDPWYEYGTNPHDHPNDINKTFLENMVADMAQMGVRWIRFEFRAETDHPSEGPGPIDWSKHDWFINELLPAYDIKALGLLGSGLIGDEDKTYQFFRINDSPDQFGRNHYTETYVSYVRQVVERYGNNVAAFEILNEPNRNQILSWETGGQVEEVNPLIYGRLVIDSYEAIQEINPEIRVVIGALLLHHLDGGYGHFDWLARVYESEHVSTYYNVHNRYPWDVVSIHPYFLTADGVVQHLHEFRTLQAEYGDMSPVWITEIGYQAQPPSWTNYGIMDPTETELNQAAFLEAIYTRIPVETPFVERIFWFKYEDFGSTSYSRWGLVRLRDSNFHYGPDATPWPRKLAFTTYKSLARPDQIPTHPVPRPADEGDRVRYFEATGQELRDPFLQYWEDHGGLAMFGYPKTRVFEVRGRKVQYFERARFEYWPEHIGTPWEVQLGLLGRYETRGRSFDRSDPPGDDHDEDESVYFSQTGQFLGGAFRDYWENNGGLEIFGFPISPEFEEVNQADGETYSVQYFERARFEWHPEHAGTDHEVQLGLLGNQVLEQPGWRR
jgi:hypothetical protein